ncbi:YggS family pyridoxal phosphate-dependent enzyme [bacterium]|nr:MAG: YggS family pyridoxal phosphate-dependent enzyme [bacterium]
MDAAAVATNLDRVHSGIADACAAAGRSADEVTLVAVSKRITPELVLAACRAGQRDLGENRVQDALARQDDFRPLLAQAGLPADHVRWHFIGHIQGNKAGRMVGRFDLIHGVDSLRLAERLSRGAVDADGTESVLLEVNISEEEAKHGFAPGATVAALEEVVRLPGLKVKGLMGMARFGATEAELRRSFASLRSLAEAGRTATGLPLPQLSMGMSVDFREAIAEGATIVRIGGAIFGPRN